MKKKLSLNVERLADLTDSELQDAVAGQGLTYTGTPGCVLSFDPPCVSSFCTLLCKGQTA